MPQFKPFRGVRYDTTRVPIQDVTAPPYDVIDARGRAALARRHRHNVVRIDLPDEADGPGRYDAAATTLSEWLDMGVLRRDEEPGYYVYRMAYTDTTGHPAHTVGVLGALTLSRPEDGEILPHEHTTPKAKTDRLELLRATRTNLSAIWGLSLSEGLSEACTIDAPADESWFDDDGVEHRLWYVTDPGRCEAISTIVGRSPIVIADGHHRFETSLAYRDERVAAADSPEGSRAAMTYVVELTEDELEVRPIHRLLTGVDVDALVGGLGDFFEFSDAGAVSDDIGVRMADAGALVLVRPDGTGTFAVPRPGVFDLVDDLDSSRLAHALDGLAGVEVRYQHGVDEILEALTRGEADAGVLLRPATVAQIRANAHSGERMPPKTTFFHPKPRTGPVLRPTD